MCGFAGFIDLSVASDAANWPTVLRRMGDAIRHRGPDSAGIWADAEKGIGLVHRRLAILDLTPSGTQPMFSVSGRYVIVFNGEIYNHLEIRRLLARNSDIANWRGHSDTETLLAAFETWGVDEALGHAVGMFAFALWDRNSHTLTLARDRFGEKPLYYGYQGNKLLFGSELKALRAHPDFKASIDRGAVTHFLRYSYVPTPLSIFNGIQKLPPGKSIQFTANTLNRLALPEPVAYWSTLEVIGNTLSSPFIGNDEDAIDTLESALSKAIRLQQVADVPLGAFLSGGVDSSTVVALMQAQSSRPVKTFTIGFNEEAYNEAEHASAVARHLGTDHTELFVTPRQALEVIPKLPQLYDEPFADVSQIPTFLVAELARGHVTVSLSGDAGDELFGGYNRHVLTKSIWSRVSRLPISVRRPLGAMLSAPSPEMWNRFYGLLAPLLPRRSKMSQSGDKIHKLAEVVFATGPSDIYQRLVSHWESPDTVVINGHEPAIWSDDRRVWSEIPDLEHQMMAQDMLSYLTDDILVKVDRAAMGVSLETRVPFLDHRVVELAWRLPLHMKIRNGQGKWVLRQVLYKYVPKALIERPKMGFGVPIDIWLRGPLRDWAESLLNESRLRQEGYFNPAPIRRKWSEHLSGQRNWQYHLWDVLMFQAWLEQERRL